MTTAVGTALVLGYGAYHALQGRLSVGQLLVVMTYVAAVYKPLEAISTTIGGLQDQIVGLQITFDLLVGYDEERQLQGIVPVTLPFAADIGNGDAVQILGQVTASATAVALTGISLHRISQ